jgi:hypothetical protein
MWRRFGSVSWLALALTAGMAGSVSAQDCASESSLKSTQTGAGVELAFRNQSAGSRRIYWIDPDGRRKLFSVVQPGNVYRQATTVGHAWVVTDEAERCLYVISATAAPMTVDIGGPDKAAQVAAPPPGTQQPVAAAAAVTPQPPAPVSPVVERSPVELYGLAGHYRLASRMDAARSLNNQDSGRPELVRTKADWESGHWLFEEVRGTPYVRIKNRWKGSLLQDSRGKLRALAASSDSLEAQWAMEGVDGQPYVRLRNRGTDRYLMASGDETVLGEMPRPDTVSHWQLVAMGGARPPVVVAPRISSGDSDAAAEERARRQAEAKRKCEQAGNLWAKGECEVVDAKKARAAAIANCRELGGHWTGETCKASKGSRPIKCVPGWEWSEEAGACQKDASDKRNPLISCKGGTVKEARNGQQSCVCPTGSSAQGGSPNFTCVASGGTTIIIPVTLPVQVKKQCPSGQTGTPPNCVALQPKPKPVVACPQGQTGTPPNCKPVQASCPPGFVGTFPICAKPNCPAGKSFKNGSCQ